MDTGIFQIGKELKLMYVEAEQLTPNAMQTAFDELEVKLTGNSSGDSQAWRTHLAGYEVFGKTDMVDGEVVYRACVIERYDGEAKKFDLPLDIVSSGEYNSYLLQNWAERMPEISELFGEMLALPSTEPDAVCVEYYKNEKNLLLLVKRQETPKS